MLVIGLCEGAGKLKGIFGVDTDGVTSLECLLGRLPQGEIFALNSRDSDWQHMVPY